ncbi:hypothetical protein K438DRAFT_1974290 [Mycena galopus ATCC 62051]|nr:hypothetical protein K438DRAFT_1974290 [Mycena galopus ATCC 62051]
MQHRDSTLADVVGRTLQNSRYVEILMPPLTNQLKDDNEDLIPLLECLATLLLKYQAFQQNPGMEEPDKFFLVVALDLLSGLTHGLGMEL